MEMFDATKPYTFTHGTVVAGVEWKSPIGTAAGTYNLDACSVYYNPAVIGAVSTKGVSPVPWEGNPSRYGQFCGFAKPRCRSLS